MCNDKNVRKNSSLCTSIVWHLPTKKKVMIVHEKRNRCRCNPRRQPSRFSLAPPSTTPSRLSSKRSLERITNMASHPAALRLILRSTEYITPHNIQHTAPCTYTPLATEREMSAPASRSSSPPVQTDGRTEKKTSLIPKTEPFFHFFS